jgi:hypothetical protein
MKEHRLKLPELALIAATRGALGFGAGLLASSKLTAKHRKVVGAALVIAGALSTIPIAYRVFRRRKQPDTDMPESVDGMVFAHDVPVIIAEVLE